jgi:monothiol glutaredoxin
MTTTLTAADRIRADVQAHDVVLFMKGTKAMPQCGFSAAWRACSTTWASSSRT